MNTFTPNEYSQLLSQLDIEHSIVEHPHLSTPPEVLHYLDLDFSDGISTMLMKVDDSYVLIIRRDDCRFDSKKIKQVTHAKNVRMATREEFIEQTQLPVGAARVYLPNFPTYIDKKVFEKEFAVGGSGSFTHSIRYKTADLTKIPGSRVVDVNKVE